MDDEKMESLLAKMNASADAMLLERITRTAEDIRTYGFPEQEHKDRYKEFCKSTEALIGMCQYAPGHPVLAAWEDFLSLESIEVGRERLEANADKLNAEADALAASGIAELARAGRSIPARGRDEYYALLKEADEQFQLCGYSPEHPVAVAWAELLQEFAPPLAPKLVP